MIALKEGVDSWSPIKWVDIGYEWTVNEVSIAEESLIGIGISESEEGRFSENDEIGCACWLHNAEIEFYVGLALEKKMFLLVLASN